MQLNWLKPDWEPGLSIPNIPIDHFLERGIKALVLDVDGTLLPRREVVIHKSVLLWVKKAQLNFALHLLSNNPSRNRIKAISEDLNINFTYKAAKPTRTALRKVQEKLQLEPRSIAMVGDRIFTDVLAGNRLGLYTVLVQPLNSDGKVCSNNKIQRLEKTIARFIGANKL